MSRQSDLQALTDPQTGTVLFTVPDEYGGRVPVISIYKNDYLDNQKAAAFITASLPLFEAVEEFLSVLRAHQFGLKVIGSDRARNQLGCALQKVAKAHKQAGAIQ